MAGLHLDPWQAAVLEGALGERADKKWSAFEVAVIVPRQNGKGAILEARELAGLFLLGEELILHSAHEFKTAAEAFRRVLSLVQSTPELEKLVAKVRTSHGDEGIELKTGQRLRFVARSTGSGRGFSGDCVVLDEAYNLSADAMAALLPTMAARPNPQLWYTSSAPLPLPVSDVLRRLCKRGRGGESEALAYFEFCADDPDDPEAPALANPSLGIRMDAEFIDREREALDADAFARERLGIWYDDENRERVIDPKLWAACEDPRSEIVGRVSFGFAVSIDRQSAAIGVAGKRADGLTHLEVVDHRKGVDWLVPRLVELKAQWRGATFTADAKGPSGAHVEDAQQAGVAVVEATLDDYKRACSSLYDDVPDRVRHLGQPVLNIAIDGAGRRIVSDAWLWSRPNSTVDISPLEAVTLAKSTADNLSTSAPLVAWR